MSGNSGQLGVPLILFSGMGADATVFFQQKLEFQNLIVPDWPLPTELDDLTAYCARLATSIDPNCPCIVGGASFGGVVALEMTQHLDAMGCLLIGSIRGPHQLPRRIRAFRSLSPAVGLVPISLLQRSALSSVDSATALGSTHFAGVTRQFSQAEPAVLRWSARQILQWDKTYDDVEVRHIHGDRDHVFPISCVEPDEIVVGGGHVISMTHGTQVNKFIRKQILQFTT